MLKGSGSRSAEQAKAIAHQCYDLFDAQRRQANALEADAEDLRMLEGGEKAGGEGIRQVRGWLSAGAAVNSNRLDGCYPAGCGLLRATICWLRRHPPLIAALWVCFLVQRQSL